MWLARDVASNDIPPIYCEFQTQSAKVLVLQREQAQQDDSNDTPLLPISEFQVNFPLFWLKAYPGLFQFTET